MSAQNSDASGLPAGVAEALAAWKERAAAIGGRDTMLNFRETHDGSIDLSGAHPSGLAQLLAGRATRLSSLVRDHEALAEARRRARAIQSKAEQLIAERALDAAHLAIGIASWSQPEQERGGDLAAPVLLRRVALVPRGQRGDDFELKLADEVVVNPALVRHLSSQHGIEVPVREWAELARARQGFDPNPVFDRLRALTKPVPGFLVLPRLVVSTFADLRGPMLQDPVPLEHPIIAGLAGDEQARARYYSDEVEPSSQGRRAWQPLAYRPTGAGSVALSTALAAGDEDPEAGFADDFAAAAAVPAPRPLQDRDPREELLVVDVDGDQQHVIDRARQGESMVVDTPPGTGATQLAVAATAALAHDGNRVLFLAQDSDALDAYAARLAEAGLEDFALDSRLTRAELRRRLISRIAVNERAESPDVERLAERHGQLRAELASHADALHRVWDPWGVSVFDTMQHLARLTSVQPSPETSVRLSEDLLTKTKEELQELKADLLEFSRLGAFTMDSSDTVWFGARISTAEEAEDASRTAREAAADYLPALMETMPALLREAGFRSARTAAEWGTALETLMRIRRSLDSFSSEVYEHSLDDLIHATANPRERAESGVEMKRSERSRLKKVAREYVRPGAHVPELHEALVQVKEEKTAWLALAEKPGVPRLPKGLAEAHALYTALAAKLNRLEPVLETTPDGGDLAHMQVEELQARLQALGEEQGALDELPARFELDRRLRRAGLSELMEDLRERRVPHELVADEFDLAWWASVLQAMARSDSAVGGHDGDHMHKIAGEFRLADAAVIEQGHNRLLWRLSRMWREVIATRSDQAKRLKAALLSGDPDLRELVAEAPEVTGVLAPVWTMSPLHVAAQLPPGPFFDTVIVADAGRISVAEALPALARARQVIALGDDRLLGPGEFRVGAERRRDYFAEAPPTTEPSLYGELSEFLPTRRLRTSYRVSPPGLVDFANRHFYDSQIATLPYAFTGDGSGLEFSYVAEGIGVPGTSTGQVESPEAEVDRVVQLVMRHARQNTRQSLAVITVSQAHAQRIAVAIRNAIRDYPYVASFFTAGRKEPFVVTHCERIHGMARDAVIFSLGYGRTRHGRVIHKLGPLSQPGSERYLAAAITRARRKLTVVSSIDPDDLDISRLSHGAALLPAILKEAAAGGITAEPAQPGDPRDPLLYDIAERLLRKGVVAQENYAGIDLAVANSLGEEHGMIVAVESDGLNYVGISSVRERERRRPEQLARRGWRHVRVWSTDAFVEPQSEADRIFSVWRETVEELSPKAVLDASRTAAQVLNRRGTRPRMRVGIPIHKCDPADVDAMVDWIQSDDVVRDDEELREQLRQALAQKARTPVVEHALDEAVRRYRRRAAGLEPEAPGTGEAREAGHADAGGRDDEDA